MLNTLSEESAIESHLATVFRAYGSSKITLLCNGVANVLNKVLEMEPEKPDKLATLK
jgi:hypothetical protein